METAEYVSLLGKILAVLEAPLEEVDRAEMQDIRDDLLNGVIPDDDALGFLIATHDALGFT